MKQTIVKIYYTSGLHARRAAELVKLSSSFDAVIIVQKMSNTESQKADAKSIMAILTLAATFQSDLLITAEGPDEDEAIDAITEYFNQT